MSATDDIVKRIDDQAKVMLGWASRYQMLRLSAMQAVFQRAAETLIDASEHMQTVDDQYQTASRNLSVYRAVADDLSEELDRAEKYSIGYNIMRVARIIRNYYR